MSAALHLDGAGFAADGRTLLGPLDLQVAGQGITVVMGANGAGKSLFLRLSHGLLPVSQGRVSWGGRRADATRAERGFMFQNTPILRRSVAQNVAFPLQALGLGEVASRVARVLDLARLTGKEHQPAARLSGGERQRMAMARALVIEPQALLMDEPSASLDPASTRALEYMIRQVVSDGVKVLIATHDIGQARRLADEVLFFNEGKLAEQAQAEAFFAAPASDAARAYLEGQI
ncbi:energy-coupling factor ABC transporter ATP-binding protein [Halovulum sp. GXIMD14793]